jgi:hypothetical protein
MAAAAARRHLRGGGLERAAGTGRVCPGPTARAGEPDHGVFAVVIVLLSWLYLSVRLLLYSAEINVVLARRLWPTRGDRGGPLLS